MNDRRLLLLCICFLTLAIIAASCETSQSPEDVEQEILEETGDDLQIQEPTSVDCLSADHLIMRVQRNGHVVEEGANMTMEHRGEVPITICADGNFAWLGEGVGMSINDYSPYSFDVCRYQIEFIAEGVLKPSDCILHITVNEEIKSGECMHFDPSKSFAYPYAPWGEEYTVGFFEFPDIAGKDWNEWERNEFLGLVHWIEEVQVWTIGHLPFCEPEGYQLLQVPTTEPWPTPTWKP